MDPGSRAAMDAGVISRFFVAVFLIVGGLTAAGEPAGQVTLFRAGQPDPTGDGPVPHLKRLTGPPRRIALVSFYLVNSGRSPGSYTVAKDGVSRFAQGLHDQGIGELQKVFAAHDLEVLVPPHGESYTRHEMKLGGAARDARSLMRKMGESAVDGRLVRRSAVAADYRLLPVHFAPTDPKIGNSLEGMRRELDVDALMIVKHGVRAKSGRIRLEDVQLLIYGPNPVPLDAEQKYKARTEAQVYIDARFEAPSPLEIAEIKRGEVRRESYEGYAALLRTIADRAAAGLVAKAGG